MNDSDETDSEVEISRKRKLNILEDKDTDESEDDEESESEDDDDESDDSEDNGDDDITLTDDVTADQCAICLMEFTDQELGVPNNCTHIFCLSCIQEWAKNINTCPVDRKVFHTIAVKKAKNGITIKEIKVEDRTQVKEEYEDPTTCEICDIGDREDRMLLCDGCDRGFHLECLSPPLDSVPEEEWYCRDCFIDNTQDNSQSQDNKQESDTIDYSQHAIAFSDDEIPTFELHSMPVTSGRVTFDPRASTSQQRRARTVATSRPRRRRRRRRPTQGSRPTGEGQRSQKKTTKKKSKSSDKGANTITASTSKSKKKKRKRRKKSAKKRNRKTESRENMPQNTSRYLLPNEMDTQATFSLFGSDFDLEYLPVYEPPASVVTSRKPSPPRLSTTANPDVLGSIFSGLNTLHSDSLSVDKKGKIISDEKKRATPPAKEPTGLRSSSQKKSTENKEKTLGSGSSSACSPKEDSKRFSIHENQHQRSNYPTGDKCKDSATYLRKDKRLKQVHGNTSTCSFTRPTEDYASFTKNRNISSKFDPENTEKPQYRDDKIRTSKLRSSKEARREQTTSRPSLSSYKIPRKNPSNPSITKLEIIDAVDFESDSKSKQPIITTENKITPRKHKIIQNPKRHSGILHLLPPEVGRSPVPQIIAVDDGLGSKESTGKNVNSRSTNVRSTFDDSANISQRQTDVDLGYTGEETVGKVSDSKSTSTLTNVPDVNKLGTFQDVTSGSFSHQPTCTPIEPSRPVAVVRPTKIDKNNIHATSREAEADKRRKEGIERLQRKQAICEEVKKALKPFYNHKEISKEDYKYIYSRAAEKISKSCLPIVSSGVVGLVRDYVKKIKGRQIQSSKSET